MQVYKKAVGNSVADAEDAATLFTLVETAKAKIS
jgi:hypothetical protein